MKELRKSYNEQQYFIIGFRLVWAWVNHFSAVLTVQREHGVEDLALHLSRTLRCTAHPQPFVQTYSSDDGITGVRRLLPLRQSRGGDDADPATQGQEITQQLETWVGHPFLVFSTFFWTWPLSFLFYLRQICSGDSRVSPCLWALFVDTPVRVSICPHYLVPLSISLCPSVLTHLSNSSLCPVLSSRACLARQLRAALSNSSVSLWFGESGWKAFWWSAVQFIKHRCWAASISAWLLPLLSFSLCCCCCWLTLPPLHSFHLLQAQVAQWGVARKKSEKEKKYMNTKSP